MDVGLALNSWNMQVPVGTVDNAEKDAGRLMKVYRSCFSKQEPSPLAPVI